ncbi:MAG TPA: hypothetical protein VKH37_06730 [Ferruginibacter sp.]|nr:hypothetical protein [Ferruginibacter sp.]
MVKKNSNDTENLFQFREKRKWQLALRRYLFLDGYSAAYGYYFGTSPEIFQQWIENQFTSDLTWENFGTRWQFDHVVPVSYFDLANEDDLLLCWNFLNVRVEAIGPNKGLSQRVDVLAAHAYFKALHERTNYSFCLKMLNKIRSIEVANTVSNEKIEQFILEHKEHLEAILALTKEEFGRYISGTSLKDLKLEREIVAKFG